MNIKHQITQIILAIAADSSSSARPADPLLSQFMEFLNSMKDAMNESGKVEEKETLSGKLETLLREVRHSGFESDRAKMLIQEILSSKSPIYPDWKKALDPRGMKIGEAIGILSSGVNVGKSMLGRMFNKETMRVEASQLGDAIIDPVEHTLTYFDKDGWPILVIEDFTPGCIKVKTRGQK